MGLGKTMENKEKRFSADIAAFGGAYFQQEFISRIYEGDTIAEACAFMKVNPAACGLYRRENKEFDAMIRDAQAFRVDLMTDRLENINDDIEDAVMAGVISKNIQWLASKRLRQIYGDKLDVNHNVHINITAAMQEAKARTIEHMGYKVLDNNDNTTDIVSVQHATLAALDEEIDPLS